MKIISILVFNFYVFSPAYAEVYKCINNKQMHYQQTPCLGNKPLDARHLQPKSNENIYKCRVKAQFEFRQTPCSVEDSAAGLIEIVPNTVSTEGLRQYIEQDKSAKKHREQVQKNKLQAKRQWMNQEIEKYVQQSKQLSRQKEREYQQRQDRASKREQRGSKIRTTEKQPL